MKATNRDGEIVMIAHGANICGQQFMSVTLEPGDEVIFADPAKLAWFTDTVLTRMPPNRRRAT